MLNSRGSLSFGDILLRLSVGIFSNCALTFFRSSQNEKMELKIDSGYSALIFLSAFAVFLLFADFDGLENTEQKQHQAVS